MDEYNRNGPVADQKLAAALGGFYDDPLGYVMFIFPWDTEETIRMVELSPEYQERFGCTHGPDDWACEFLDSLGEEIKANAFDGKHAVDAIMRATVSGHGIGKTTLVAWLIKFIMDTRPGSRGTVTANTDIQLRTKTWAELGKWHNISLTKHWFKYNAGRGNMSLVIDDPDAEVRGQWRCDAQTCREENSESFAGQHAPSATSFYIFDEAGGIADKIFEVREGGLTDGEPMVFDFGNGTRNTGKFFEGCNGRDKHRFQVRSIDSRSCKLTNKDKIAEWIESFGIDSDFVKVRVRGMFPSKGSMQFIGSLDVKRAMERPTPTFLQTSHEPIVIGVDCARHGDDESVLKARQGIDARSWPARRYRELDVPQLVDKIVEMFNDFVRMGQKPQMIFVDQGNFGIAVVDYLRRAGYPVMGVDFGKAAKDGTYRYVGDMIWGRLRDAICTNLVLPDHGEEKTDLEIQLTQREFDYVKERIALEAKKDMKSRLGVDVASSPDLSDAYALTFFMEILKIVEPDQRNTWEQAGRWVQEKDKSKKFEDPWYSARG